MKYEILQEKEKTGSKNNPENSHVQKPSWTLNEIALPTTTIEQIKEMIAFIRGKDKLLHQWQFQRFLKSGGGLVTNFFGNPGTGKSITAEGVANELDMSVIKVNYGEMQSELMGGTAKSMNSLFQEAEESNSVIIFDEADSLISQRISRVSQAADHDINTAKSTLLTLLDQTRSVVIFTSNFFGNYDPAVLRRILFNIEFLPPNDQMLQKLWEFHLSPNIPKNISYERLAEISHGLCGGDIRNITIKLGLKLLVAKVIELDETIVQAEITQYLATKNRYQELRQSISEFSFQDVQSHQSTIEE